MKVRAALAIITAVVVTTTSARAVDVSVRYITWFNGPPAAYRIVRGGKRIVPKSLGMTLREGDCVEIVQRLDPARADTENDITLKIDGREVMLGPNSPSYCVERPVRVPAAVLVAAQAFASLASWFETARSDYYSERTIPARSRGGDSYSPRIPLVPDGSTIILGNRALAVGWTNGTRPFDVAIFREGARLPLAVQRRVEQRRVQFPEVQFVQSTYLLEVRDAVGRTARAQFSAVEEGRAPQATAYQRAALNVPSLSPDERSLLVAGLFASAGWKLEAYQSVASRPALSDPVRAIALELVGGE
jgi:hypothetical protein